MINKPGWFTDSLHWVVYMIRHSDTTQYSVGSLPDVGRVSRYLVDANLTTFRVNSAEVPPMTIARW